MNQKLKIVILIALLVISFQWARIQLPMIIHKFSNKLNTSSGMNIELFIVKKIKTPKGTKCNEITPLINTDLGRSFYQIITNRDIRLVVSLNKRGCIEEYI